MAISIDEFKQNMGRFSGITADSRRIIPGFLFVAVRGKTVDGHDFIPQALAKGAKAIVGEKYLKINGASYLKVNDSREALGILASEYYGNPSKKMKVIGVTGTKGKTTTSHIIYHILSELGQKVGLISSIVAKIADKEVSTGLHVTSPDVVSLHKFLHEMHASGCKYVVIEVSSHGIDQKRIAGVDFDVGILTNIAPEHLDYHKTFAEYKKIKMSFLKSARVKIIAPRQTDIKILPGIFNNIDAQAGVDAVVALGFAKRDALKVLTSFKLPQGRLEEIETKLGFRIFIDFAHTPNSLEAVLGYLKKETKGKVVAVFGCAGERDRKKRRSMGRISANLSDFSVFTAEDPRTEDINTILGQMARGAKDKGGVEGRDFVRIPLRGEAIAYALSQAKPGDIVGIFGKGHEKSMAYKGFEHPWSDHEAVSDFLQRNSRVSAIILAAGKGSRMKSAKPKILHEICGRPMISYSLQNLREAGVGEIVAVTSYRKNLVIKEIKGAVKIAFQKNAKGGTADAVSAGMPQVSGEAKEVIVLYGDDTAFYTSQTIKKVLENHLENRAVLTFVTLMKENPQGLGRIIRDSSGKVLRIVEEKDATEEERTVKEVNDGLYVFNKEWLKKNLAKIEKSPVTGEYYLVDLIKMAIGQNEKVTAYKLPTDSEWQGVNTPEELVRAEERMREKLEKYNG